MSRVPRRAWSRLRWILWRLVRGAMVLASALGPGMPPPPPPPPPPTEQVDDADGSMEDA